MCGSPISATLLPTHSGVSANLCSRWERSSVTRLPLSRPLWGVVKSHEDVKNHSQILRKAFQGKCYNKTQWACFSLWTRFVILMQWAKGEVCIFLPDGRDPIENSAGTWLFFYRSFHSQFPPIYMYVCAKYQTGTWKEGRKEGEKERGGERGRERREKRKKKRKREKKEEEEEERDQQYRANMSSFRQQSLLIFG